MYVMSEEKGVLTAASSRGHGRFDERDVSTPIAGPRQPNSGIPKYGRFLEPDPIGIGGGINLYGYTANDPLNYVDPLGLAEAAITITWCSGSVYSDGGTTYCVAPGASLPGNGPPATSPIGPPMIGGGPAAPERRSLSDCAKSFLKDNLSRRGLPTSQLNSVQFVKGLDNNANWMTRTSYNSSGNHAVTQGSTIYVHPQYWGTYTTFQSADPFEEVYHTAQFASEGAGFYDIYVLSYTANLLLGDGRFGSYMNDVDEAFAKGDAKETFAEAKSFMCKK